MSPRAQREGIEDAQGSACIVVVSTPLQYINAVEYVHRYQRSSATLLVVASGFNKDLIGALPGQELWHRKLYVPWSGPTLSFLPPRFSRLFQQVIGDLRTRRSLGTVMPQTARYGTVVIGNRNDVWHRHLAHTLGGQKVVVVDDGATTVAVPGSTKGPGRSERLRVTLSQIAAAPLREYTLFTAYSVDPPGTMVLHNDYRYHRELVPVAKGRTRQVWFLGQPLYTRSAEHYEAYVALLRSIGTGTYGDAEIVYRLHPRENVESVKRISAELGWTYALYNQPVEIELLRAERLPRRIAMLYSSAFQSCTSLFGPAVPFDVFEPSPSFWSGRRHNNHGVYDYLKTVAVHPHRYFEVAEGGELQRFLRGGEPGAPSTSADASTPCAHSTGMPRSVRCGTDHW